MSTPSRKTQCYMFFFLLRTDPLQIPVTTTPTLMSIHNLSPCLISLSVLMQTHSGCMFGGYTDLSWSSRFKRGKFSSSPNCFLFTLINPFDTPPTKFDVLHPPYAINNHPG